MADDRDLALAQLAVEAGFITRDEARQYWRQVQSPGAPRLASLLVQQGRLKPAQLDQLRAMFLARAGGAGAATATAAPPAPLHTLPEGDHVASRQLSAEEIWNEALAKDRQLAAALLQRQVVPQDRLRECHQLQLQHRMRLGAVLVRKGYVDQATIDSLSLQLEGSRQPVADPRGTSGRQPMTDPRGTSGRTPRPPGGPTPPARPPTGALATGGLGSGSSLGQVGSGLAPISGLGPISGLAPIAGLGPTPLGSGLGPAPGIARLENPFASVRPGLNPPGLNANQDDVPTVTEGSPAPMFGIASAPLTPAERLAAPTTPPPSYPGGSPQDAIPTLLDRSQAGFGLSVDELNPFAADLRRNAAAAATPPESPAAPASLDELSFGAAKPSTDSAAVTLEQEPPGAGWGAGPGLTTPGAGEAGEAEAQQSTFPPSYPVPGIAGDLSPAAGAEHVPAAPAKPAKGKGKSKLTQQPKPAAGGSRKWLVVVLLLLLLLAGGGAAAAKFYFRLF